MTFNESIIIDATLEWFRELGYAVGHGPHLASGVQVAERASIKNYLAVRFARWLNP